MATRKDVLVKVRVDAATKELWVRAAGGERRLSDWIRERLGAAVEERDGNSPERRRVEDVGSTPTTAPSRSSTAVCERWRMHRSGEYCKACDSTPK